jgi:hypothetical protein
MPPDPWGPAPALSLFGPEGLPSGVPARDVWESLLGRLDETLEQEGWDRPARLMGLSTPASGQERFDELALSDVQVRRFVAADRDGPERFAVPYVAADLLEVTGTPRESLLGFIAPSWVAALVLAMEGWASKRHDVAPLQDPEMREFRLLLSVTRSGEQFSHLRFRGGDAEGLKEHVIDGFLAAGLRRALRLPLTPAQAAAGITVRQYLGAIAARNVGEQLHALFGQRADVPVGAAEPMETLRTILGEAPARAGGEVRDRIVSQLVLRTVLTLGWSALGRDEVKAAGGRTSFADLVSGRELGETAAARLTRTIASGTAGLSWTSLAGTVSGRTFMPPSLAGHLDWCGDDLIGLEVGTNFAPDTAAELRRVDESGGPACGQQLRELLRELRWEA